MEILAYIASALIGISLGLIGGGGSIMTVPVLVYLFGIVRCWPPLTRCLLSALQVWLAPTIIIARGW